jgi:O-antigen/teichoic acid export membrane protein
MLATLGVGFFLAPFLVHRLGNTVYGVWILVISSVNYLNLLDLGMRFSVLRFVSKGHATNDHQAASEALSSAFWVRLQISALVLLLCGGLAALFPIIFDVPPALVSTVRQAVLIIGVSTSVTMSIGVTGGVLSALNRYDLQSYVTLTQLAIRVVGIVAVLSVGGGIVAVAFCELLAAVVGNALLAYISRRIYPQLRIQFTRPRPEVIRKIWSYSFYAFLLTIAGQLIYQTDNLVVGALVSASAVTFYAIGNSLCRYTQQFIYAMTATFNPAASTYESRGDMSKLRSLYYNGTRAAMVISLPIVLTLIIRGRSFIRVWMGDQYSHSSGIVLAILGIALMVSLSNSTAASIAWGTEKHKTVAMWVVPEAIVNLALSMVLARRIGIYGVAIGTLAPSLIVQLVLWPRYVSRLVPNVSWIEVYRKVWAPVYFAAVPFAVGSFAIDSFFPARNMTIFILQTIALLPLLGATVAFVFRHSINCQLLPRARTLLRERVG